MFKQSGAFFFTPSIKDPYHKPHNHMSPSIGYVIDPLNPGRQIPQNDQRFSEVFKYYDWLAIFQKIDDDARDLFRRTWHQYAVQLLQTANALGITTRPPNFRPAPEPSKSHFVTISEDYKASVDDGPPVASVPPDPDPRTEAIAPNPKDPNDYIIVRIAAPPVIFTTGGASPAAPAVSPDVAALQAMVQQLLAELAASRRAA